MNLPEQAQIALPEDQAVLVFQSVRELLINSLKYAGTGVATVTVGCHDDQLRIQVRDEGVGFDVTAAKAAASTPAGKQLPSKFGLFSIGERMQALGGSFDIQSAPRRGVIATLILPLNLRIL